LLYTAAGRPPINPLDTNFGSFAISGRPYLMVSIDAAMTTKGNLGERSPSAMHEEIGLLEAEETLAQLSQAFLSSDLAKLPTVESIGQRTPERKPAGAPDLEAKHKALMEQIPAVIFIAPMDSEGLSEAYVSPQIESILGFTRKEWLGGPGVAP
jgi:hypothetical protein